MTDSAGISIVISCTQDKNIRQSLLASIAKQDAEFQVETIEIESTAGPRRMDGWLQAKNPFVLFLDEDCELPEGTFLSQLYLLFQRNPQVQILGGAYRNPANPNYLTEAHNLICEAWIRQGFLEANARTEAIRTDATDVQVNLVRPCMNLVGGFLAFARCRMAEIDKDSFATFWGGEETFLLRKLYEKGVTPYFIEELAVVHHSESSWKKWMRRAWLQGFYRGKLNLNTMSSTKDGRDFILKKGLPYLLPMTVHFAVMNVASSLGRLSSLRFRNSFKPTQLH